mgnify:CR=1 FL=1
MEKEKMLSGQLYDPSDEELSALRIKARKLARRYNSTDEDNWETLNEILKELVPNRGEGTFFQAPVYFDYGCFTTFGKNCGANFNFNERYTSGNINAGYPATGITCISVTTGVPFILVVLLNHLKAEHNHQTFPKLYRNNKQISYFFMFIPFSYRQ